MPLVTPWDLWSNFNFFQKFPNTSKVSLEGSSVCLKAIERSDIKIYALRIEKFFPLPFYNLGEHSNFDFGQNGRNSFKNGRMRAVEFPPPILAEPTPKLPEIFPNWPHLAQIGAQKTNHGSNFGQIRINSARIGGGN
jgi:hypothetical protein